jgi:hypothetical protein
MVAGAEAATLDWASRPATNLLTSTDSATVSGVTITTHTVPTGTATFSTNPTDADIDPTNSYSGSSPGVIVLGMDAASDTGTAYQTTTITFSPAVYNLQLTMRDIDGGVNYNNFNDIVDFSSNAGLPTSWDNASGVDYNSATGRASANQSIGITDETGNITVTWAGPVSSVTITHIAGPKLGSPSNPSTQIVYIDDLVFSTAATATLKLKKVSNGGTGTFSFTQTNLSSTPGNITTSAAGTPAPVSPTPIAVTTLGTAVTLTETPAAGFAVTAASCIDGNSAVTGNTGTLGTLAGNVLTIPAANVVAGSDFVCTFTNASQASLKLQKISLNGTGTFSYSQSNLVSNPGNITTSTAGVAAPTTPVAIPVTALNTNITITETPLTGFAIISASCTDANSGITGNTGSFGTLSGNVLTIPAARVVQDAAFQCSFTNSRAAVSVQKLSLGNTGTFSFTDSNIGGTFPNITTTAANTLTPIPPVPRNVTTLTNQVQLNEGLGAGFVFNTVTCTDSLAAITGNAPVTTTTLPVTIPAASIQAGGAFNCIFTNTKTPTVKFRKQSIGGTATFSFNTRVNLASTPANIDTAVANPGPAAPTAINITNVGQQVQLTEAAVAGFAMTGFSCVDANSANTGNTGTFGTFNAVSRVVTIPALNVVAGADLTCTITNTRATVKFVKQSIGGTSTFSFTTPVNIASVPAAINTATSNPGPAAPTAINITAVGSQVQLTETAVAGYTLTGFGCVDANSAVTNNTGTFGTFNATTRVVTIPAVNVVAGADLTCTIRNTRAAVKFTKQSVGGTANFSFNTPVNIASAPADIDTSLANPGPAVPSAISVTTLGSQVQLTEAAVAGYTMTDFTCTDANSAINGNTGTFGSFDPVARVVTIAGGKVVSGADISCAITNTKNTTLQVAKDWGANAVVTDTANIGATTGGAANTTAFTAVGGTAANSGTAVNIAVGNTITLPAETFTPVASAANYTTSLACTADGGATANTLSGTNGQVANTLVIGAGDAGKAIVCSYTNTRKSTTVVINKVWAANAIAGDAITIPATTSLINNTAALPSTATAAGNTTAGTSRVVYAGETLSFPAETFGTGLPANYTSVITCSSGTLTGPADGQLATTSLSITAAMTGAAITCSYTNTRRSTTFRLAKAWAANSIAGNVASLGATSGLIDNTALFTAPASATTNGATVTIYAGETATLPVETMTTGSLANYTTAVSCNAGTLTGTNGQAAGNTLAVAAADIATAPITCTYTNTRNSASLTLRKTWVNGRSGETATVSTGAGFINAASSGLSTSTGSNTTTGTSVTVYAGESGAISETGTNLANYTPGYACTGTSGLSGSTLTVGAADTAIICTLTNTRNSATLTLSKTWVNGLTGETATVATGAGFTNAASSGLSTSTGNNTTTGTSVTVFAGESGAISETGTNLVNYTASYACTGTSGLSGSTLTVGAADTAIACTLTNTRKSASLTLAKTWVNGRTGETATVSSTGFVNAATSGLSTSAGSNTTTGTSVTVFAGESGTITEAGTNLGNYNAVLACAGNATALSGSTLTVSPVDTALTCTITNTRKQTSLRVDKAWGANSISGNVARIGATTGLQNNTAVLNSTAPTNSAGTIVTVFAGETATLPAETMTTGVLANYTTGLVCNAGTLSSANGQVANTLAIAAADVVTSPIVCTYTNNRKQALLTLRKTWSSALAGETATVTSSGFVNAATSGLSTSTGSNTTTGISVTVFAGESGTISETATNAGNYTTALACAGTSGLAGTTLTVGAADTAIVCTYTNTRRQTNFRLRKAWGANSIAGNVANIGVTTGLTNNTAAFNSTASTATNGAIRVVYAGETATLPAETMSTGTLANYATVVACNAGTLTGTNGQAAGNTVAISAADTATATITCTYTNTRKSASLTLIKTWSGATSGHTATVASSGFINAASSGVSTSTGNNTTTGTAVTVYAGETGTISETGSNLSSYIQALACTGTSGLSGTTLTVSNADTAIACTYTNTLAVPLLTVTKTPSVSSVAAAGAAITYTIRVTDSGNVAATSVTVTDPLGTVTCPGGNPIPTLAVGAFVDCSMSYTITQAVFDSNGGGDGDLDNTASANGTTAFGTVSQTGSAAVTLTGAAGLTLSKTRVFAPGPSGDVNGNGTADVGDTIIYRYDVTNAGNRTVTGVNINLDNHNGFGSNPTPSNEAVLTDIAPAGDSTDAATDASWDSLAPGDTVRFTWAYVVVQSDVDLLQ